MTEKSLIITNVFSKNGYKTYTYRWLDDEDITWKDIFQFVYSKTSFTPDFYTIHIGGKTFKYEDLAQYKEFCIDDYLYYNTDGTKTSTGTLTFGTNMNTFTHHNVILQW